MRRKYIIFLLFCLSLHAGYATAQSISISGTWRYRPDPEDIGIKAQWYNQSFDKNITLPGTLDDAKTGASSSLDTNTLNKEILLMLTRRHRYVGPVWYRREITIPAGWQGKTTELVLERVLWDTRIWVDGKDAGTEESLSTPHRYILRLAPGKHAIVVRVDNRKRYNMSIRDMAHAYTDGTQIIWNGMIGEMTLTAREPVYLEHAAVYAQQSVKVQLFTQNNTSKVEQRNVQVRITDRNKRIISSQNITVTIAPGASIQEVIIPAGKEMQFWDEFHPHLYTLTAQLEKGNTLNSTFGRRELTNHNGLLQVNGQRIFLRGTLECSIFPLTGHPPMTRTGWLKVFSTAKAYGLNHLRFHSWCPPEAAFAVADSMGFYLQVELPFWNNNAGKEDAMNRFLEAEAFRISREYGNHPSFCFWSLGNELEGDFTWLAKLRDKLREHDPRHLYTGTTFTFQRDHGRWPEPGDDFFITQYTKKGWVRGQGIFNTIPPAFGTDYTKETDSISVPLITHEIGQYSVYPNLQEIKKYTGVLDPLNFKAIRRDLEKKGLLHLAPQFLMASGRFAANLYKEEIERALKTGGLSGFQLLDLHDFPGQGTALIGILDAFWDSKGLVAPSTHRSYCGPVVPLLRFEKAAYTHSEFFRSEVQIANFSGSVLHNSVVEMTARTRSGKQIASGQLKPGDIETGNAYTQSGFTFSLKDVQQAEEVTIEVRIRNTPYRNQWRIWVYPATVPATPPVVVFINSPAEALQQLQLGKTVLLNPDTAQLKGVEGRFAPVFWSPVHFPDQPGTMRMSTSEDFMTRR